MPVGVTCIIMCNGTVNVYRSLSLKLLSLSSISESLSVQVLCSSSSCFRNAIAMVSLAYSYIGFSWIYKLGLSFLDRFHVITAYIIYCHPASIEADSLLFESI